MFDFLQHVAVGEAIRIRFISCQARTNRHGETVCLVYNYYVWFSVLVLQKEHHEQQLQRVRASSAKSQAESALTVFELREENHRLANENSKLLGKSSCHIHVILLSAVGFHPLLQLLFTASAHSLFIVYNCTYTSPILEDWHLYISLVPNCLLARVRKVVKRVTLPCPGCTYSAFQSGCRKIVT